MESVQTVFDKKRGSGHLGDNLRLILSPLPIKMLEFIQYDIQDTWVNWFSGIARQAETSLHYVYIIR
jgi:hypothetical protein